MHVSEIMVAKPVTVPDDATLSVAMRLLDRHGVRHLPVMRGQALVGVLSDRDLLEAVGWLVSHVGEDVELGPALVREIMQPLPVTVPPDETAARAAALLVEWGVGCLPVSHERAMVGLVTEIDLLEAFARSRGSAPGAPADDPPVEALMTADVVTVRDDAPLAEAAEILRRGEFRHLPVVEGARLLGILSDRDLRRAVGGGAPEEAEVGEVKTRAVSTVEPSTPLSRAAAHMARERIGALPVVGAEERLVGILTVTDVLAHCGTVL